MESEGPVLEVVTRGRGAFPGVWNPPAYVSLPWNLVGVLLTIIGCKPVVFAVSGWLLVPILTLQD